MEVSFKFRNIEKYLLKIQEEILKSQDMLKYIYYLDNNPLSNIDISDDIILKTIKKQNIILTLFNSKTITKDSVQVFLNPINGNLENQPSSDIYFDLIIAIPNTKWILEGLGELRAYRICDEFCKMFDETPAGLGSLVVTKFNSFAASDTHSCLQLIFRIKSCSMKGKDNG